MTPAVGSLVLYKSGPAKVLENGTKIEIQLARGKTVKVRPKDVTELHPGPVADLAALQPGSASLPEEPSEESLAEIGELLDGEPTTLAELTELVYGEHSPVTAWAGWRLLIQGLYFEGSVDAIRARLLEDVARDREERARKAVEKAAWAGFLERVEAGRIEPADRQYLGDVEELALLKRSGSRVLKAIGRDQTPANAHTLLLRLGVWDAFTNPYPERAGLALDSPQMAVPALPDEPRRDLTHLDSWAIDDEGNEDPDDAISIDGNRLWVHVADVAALVTPDSELDLEARGRAGTLYLPELTATMLPEALTPQLGMGLQAISPALSIGMDMNDDGSIAAVEVVLSRVKVQRLSYQQVDARLAEAPFSELATIAERYRLLRQRQGAVTLSFPEMDIKVRDGEVHLRPFERLQSRQLVSEAMLMAGEAAARYAVQHELPFAYATQEIPEEVERSPQGAAAMMAARRKMRPRRYQGAPAPHQGLGLALYAQVTSPLRRYLDLVAHQQLRAHLLGQPLLDEEQMIERIGAADVVSPLLRKTERLSRQHWTLVWLKAQKGWRGEAILVAIQNRNGQVQIPALGLEVRIPLKQDLALDQLFELESTGVDLAQLDAHFRLPK